MNKESEKTIGTIKSGFMFTSYIGEGKFKYNSNKNKKFEMLISATTGQPMIRCGEKYFVLTWENIIELAEKAGLFNDDEVANE